MHITYHGLSCFKIVAKTEGRGSDDVTFILGPYGKKTGLQPLQSKADVAIVPHHSDVYDAHAHLRGDLVVLDQPGEYAVAGVNVVAVSEPADPREGVDRGNATIFALDVEGLKIAYAAAIGAELSPDTYDLLGGADILFLSVGDEGGVDAKTAEVIARKVEPKMIIPMHYATVGVDMKGLRTIDDFCGEIGSCPKEEVDKLVVKASQMQDSGTMQVVTLKKV